VEEEERWSATESLELRAKAERAPNKMTVTTWRLKFVTLQVNGRANCNELIVNNCRLRTEYTQRDSLC
jgi:hypothetical protein